MNTEHIIGACLTESTMTYRKCGIFVIYFFDVHNNIIYLVSPSITTVASAPTALHVQNKSFLLLKGQSQKKRRTGIYLEGPYCTLKCKTCLQLLYWYKQITCLCGFNLRLNLSLWLTAKNPSCGLKINIKKLIFLFELVQEHLNIF